MPWAGICQKCDFVCIAYKLKAMKEMFIEHYDEEHKEASLQLPYDMHSMNKEAEIYPNDSAEPWISKQYFDDNIWVCVISRSDYKIFSYLLDKKPSQDVIKHIKLLYW